MILEVLENNTEYKQQDIESIVQDKCKDLNINTFKDVQRTVRKLYSEGKYFKRIKKGTYRFEKDYNVETNIGKEFSQEVKNKVLERDGYICQLCGKELRKEEKAVDHIIPLSVGGTNTKENGQIVCYDCNNRKENRENKEVINKNINELKRRLKFLESKQVIDQKI